MKYCFLFQVNKSSTAAEAIAELSCFLKDIYEIDDPETGTIQIGGSSNRKTPPAQLSHATLVKRTSATQIDWQQQWSDFAPGFYAGLAHIDLQTLGGSILLLKPGAGFGDLSHPTTRLTLALLAPLVKDKCVIDIGCGSGILSIASVLLGAKRAFGLDIDPHAISHAKENAQLNRVEDRSAFSLQLPTEAFSEKPLVIVMNMIAAEQKTAWQSLPQIHSCPAWIVTSGVLSSQREHYLQLVSEWGWSLLNEREEEGWMGFVFTQLLDA